MDQLQCGAISTFELFSKPRGGNLKGDGEGRVRAGRNNNKFFWVEKSTPGAAEPKLQCECWMLDAFIARQMGDRGSWRGSDCILGMGLWPEHGKQSILFLSTN